jgi:hypothetical protein
MGVLSSVNKFNFNIYIALDISALLGHFYRTNSDMNMVCNY